MKKNLLKRIGVLGMAGVTLATTAVPVMADEIDDARAAVAEAEVEKDNAQQELADAQNAESDANKAVTEADMAEVSANHAYLSAQNKYNEAVNAEEYIAAVDKVEELIDAQLPVLEDRFLDENGKVYENSDFMWEEKVDQAAVEAAQAALAEAQKPVVDEYEVNRWADALKGSYNAKDGTKFKVEYDKKSGKITYTINKKEVTQEQFKAKADEYNSLAGTLGMRLNNLIKAQDGTVDQDAVAAAQKALEDAQNNLVWQYKDGFDEDAENKFNQCSILEQKIQKAQEKLNELMTNINGLQSDMDTKYDAWLDAIKVAEDAAATAKELYDNSVAKGKAFDEAIKKYNDAVDRLNNLLNRPIPPTSEEIEEAIEDVKEAAEQVQTAVVWLSDIDYIKTLIAKVPFYASNVAVKDEIDGAIWTYNKRFSTVGTDKETLIQYVKLCLMVGREPIANTYKMFVFDDIRAVRYYNAYAKLQHDVLNAKTITDYENLLTRFYAEVDD